MKVCYVKGNDEIKIKVADQEENQAKCHVSTNKSGSQDHSTTMNAEHNVNITSFLFH